MAVKKLTQDDLIVSHVNYAGKRKMMLLNYGYYQSSKKIQSKTDKGMLTSVIDNGKITHSVK